MAHAIKLRRDDNGFAAVTPNGTDQTGTSLLINGIQTVTAVGGATATKLPLGASGPIVVRNTAATAVALLVFPPTLGSINGGTVTTGSFSIAQNKVTTFYPHPNGIDYSAHLGA